LTTEVALEVIGVIGIAIIAGMAIYHIIEVFDDPDSTALDKVLSFTDLDSLFDHQIHHYLGYTKTPHRHSMLLGH
jgi:hypothetical protein